MKSLKMNSELTKSNCFHICPSKFKKNIFLKIVNKLFILLLGKNKKNININNYGQTKIWSRAFL